MRKTLLLATLLIVALGLIFAQADQTVGNKITKASIKADQTKEAVSQQEKQAELIKEELKAQAIDTEKQKFEAEQAKIAAEQSQLETAKVTPAEIERKKAESQIKSAGKQPVPEGLAEMQRAMGTPVADKPTEEIDQKAIYAEKDRLALEEANRPENNLPYEPNLILAIGDNCTTPLVVTINNPAVDLPYNDLNQTTCGRVNDYSATCLGYYDGGEDIIYKIINNSAAAINVNIVLTTTTTYTGMAVDYSCPPGATCLAYVTNGGAGGCSLYNVPIPAGSTLYLMIDTWPSPACIPSFNLNISRATGACCVGEVCAATNSQAECDAMSGVWYVGQTCPEFTCPPEFDWDCTEHPPTDKLPGGDKDTPSEPLNNLCTTTDAFVQCEYAYCGAVSAVGDIDWYKLVVPNWGNSDWTTFHFRVFADDTPYQYAQGGGLDAAIWVYTDCAQPQVLYDDDYNYGDLFPNAEGTDAQIDFDEAGNLFAPGTILYIRVSSFSTTSYYGPYLFIINCEPRPTPTGACCVGEVCVATNTLPECNAIPGQWYQGQTCPAFVCPPEFDWDCTEHPPYDKLPGGNIDTPTEPLNDSCHTSAAMAMCEYAYCGTIDYSGGDENDWYSIVTPADGWYSLHIRVFGDDTPYQYAYGGGLDPWVAVYGTDCLTQLLYNSDYYGTWPDAVNWDAQIDASAAGNCFPPNTLLHIKIGGYLGPYLLIINCVPCEEPTGACCVDEVCVATNYQGDCDLMGGQWFQDETCPEFTCPPEFDWDCYEHPPTGKTGGADIDYLTEPANNTAAGAAVALVEYAYCGSIGVVGDADWYAVTLPAGPDPYYCLHVRVFADDTPYQYAYGGTLDPTLFIYDSNGTTQLHVSYDHHGTFPDAEVYDSQVDCLDAGNCYPAGKLLYIKIIEWLNEDVGPYLLIINAVPCLPPQGRCCDYTNPAVPVCTDDVLQPDCQGEFETWSAGLNCTDNPCPALPTGRCCDYTSGPSTPACTDGIYEQNCQGEDMVWSSGLNCTDNPCPSIAGACCYGNPLSPSCIDGITENACYTTYDGYAWTLGALCTDDPSPCPPVLEGDICDVPIVITLDENNAYTDTRDLCLYENDYNYSGRDVIYSFTPDETIALTIQTCNSADEFDDYLGLSYAVNCGTYTSLISADYGCATGNHGKFIYTFVADSDYVLMIDSWYDLEECGNYTLEINEYIPPTGRCCYYDEDPPDLANPLCAAPVTEAACNTLIGTFSGTWIEGITSCITDPCPVPGDFDGTETFDAMLDKFTHYANDATTYDWQWIGTDGNPAGCAVHYYNYSVYEDDYLISNGTYTVPNVPNIGLIFDQSDVFSPGSWYVLHEVLVSTNFTGNPATATWTQIYAGDAATTWETKGASLEAFRNQGVNIAFHYTGTNADDWFVDNISVEVYIPPTGACCVEDVCVATNTEAQCTALTGTWYEGETCPTFACDPCLGAVYTNGDPNPAAYVSATQCDPYYAPPWAAGIADDFVLPGTGPVNITSVVAWMGHWNHTPLATPADYDGVTVTFYANSPDSTPDEPGGKPIDGDPDCGHMDVITGGVIYSTHVSVFSYVEEEPGTDIWRLTLPVTVTLTGGVTYWLEVAPILDFTNHGQTGWWPTSSLTGLFPMQIFESVDPPVPEWTAMTADVAFCLHAFIEPTGACCVDEVCVATNTASQCAAMTGTWHAGETCPAFDCSLPSCYEYLPGDVNMAVGAWPPAASNPDVTYLVNFFRGIPTVLSCKMYNPLAPTPTPTCFWASADANGSCDVIGSDVTKLVNIFRGLATVQYCPHFVPCWPTPVYLPPAAPAGWPNCEVPCPPTTVTGERVIDTPNTGGK